MRFINKTLLGILLFSIILSFAVHIVFAAPPIGDALMRTVLAIALMGVGAAGGLFVLYPQYRMPSCPRKYFMTICTAIQWFPALLVFGCVLCSIYAPSVFYFPMYPSAGLSIVATLFKLNRERYGDH
jgi:hypothetical protein